MSLHQGRAQQGILQLEDVRTENGNTEGGNGETEHPVLWQFSRGVAQFLTTVFFDLRVYGAEHVPAEGGALIVSNHQSFLDPVVLGVRLGRPLSYIAKSELFEIAAPVTWVLRSLGGFPVRQGAGDVGAVKESIRRLKEGHVLNIFPEGQRTEDGEIGRMEKGVALIVRRARVPVVPAVVVGAYEAWPIGATMFRTWPIRVEFGPAMELADLSAEEIVGRVDGTLRRMFRELRERCGGYAVAGGDVMAEADGDAGGEGWIGPQAFGGEGILRTGGAGVYLGEELAGKLAGFFERKGLAAIKEEDRGEVWYADWLKYQAGERIYGRLLSPGRYSRFGGRLDLRRLTRFLEVFGYFSPAHGYSLQVTFLGLFSILAGKNEALKREAVGVVEGGGLLAFGVSERGHGADLLATEFAIREVGEGRYVAEGSKYYIGNANCAGMIAVLARKEKLGAAGRRAPLALVVIRPGVMEGFGGVEKIRTMGIRPAFVGSFEVKGQELLQGDVAAEGREAWDSVFGTVTLGKFFLGFGAIGICERAFGEGVGHLKGRVLYGKPAIAMGHLRRAVVAAWARLFAMKLYAYRCLDYVVAGREEDRRYLLFTAVQKAKVSTEGVKVMGLLSECVGAFGFEGRTFFEMGLRDIQLIPGLEGSVHVNLAMTAEFLGGYFGEGDHGGIKHEDTKTRRHEGEGRILEVPSVMVGGGSGENEYLMEAAAGGFHRVLFSGCMEAYRSWKGVRNVGIFARQVRGFRMLLRAGGG